MSQDTGFWDQHCLQSTKEAGRKEHPDGISYSYLHVNSDIRIRFWACHFLAPN